MNVEFFAKVFVVLTIIVVLFQICLAVGLPWGAASMGGKYPGKYPKKMRISALTSALILIILACVVLVRAELAFPSLFTFSTYAIWVVAAFMLLNSVTNIITPSKIERIWAPVTLVQLVSTVVVALS